MVRRALVVLCLGLMTILLASCGQTYELQSITVTATAASIDRQPRLRQRRTSRALATRQRLRSRPTTPTRRPGRDRQQHLSG